MGLPVYHMFEQEIREEIAPDVWEEHLGMMEMVLEPEALADAVRSIREQHSEVRL